MKKNFTLLFVILILLTACDSTTATPPTPPTTDSVTQSSPTLTDIPLPAGYGVDGGWFQLYFTIMTFDGFEIIGWIMFLYFSFLGLYSGWTMS